MESIFHPDPYGYRPWCGALEALARCGQRGQKNWMLDLDVQKFADSVDHDLMVKAVQANVTPAQRWVVLYVKRWLKAPLASPDGTLQARDPGNTAGRSHPCSPTCSCITRSTAGWPLRPERTPAALGAGAHPTRQPHGTPYRALELKIKTYPAEPPGKDVPPVNHRGLLREFQRRPPADGRIR